MEGKWWERENREDTIEHKSAVLTRKGGGEFRKGGILKTDRQRKRQMGKRRIAMSSLKSDEDNGRATTNVEGWWRRRRCPRKLATTVSW